MLLPVWALQGVSKVASLGLGLHLPTRRPLEAWPMIPYPLLSRCLRQMRTLDRAVLVPPPLIISMPPTTTPGTSSRLRLFMTMLNLG